MAPAGVQPLSGPYAPADVVGRCGFPCLSGAERPPVVCAMFGVDEATVADLFAALAEDIRMAA